jgi:hypothetical protein
MSTLQAELQRLSGTKLDAQGAANVWAGTTGLALVGALNAKNGTTGLELLGVLNDLADTTGLGEVEAARRTVPPPKITPAPSATANAGGTATVSFTTLTTTPTVSSYTATSTPGGLTATGTGSPLTVTGLTAATVYTFTVRATNVAGTGPESDPSNSITALA